MIQNLLVTLLDCRLSYIVSLTHSFSLTNQMSTFDCYDENY